MLGVFLVVAPVAILGLFAIASKIDPETGRWQTHGSVKRNLLNLGSSNAVQRSREEASAKPLVTEIV